jgi:serine/threonine-protein kinase RsbW
MEVCQAVVAPAHRRRGVMKELVDLLIAEARQRGLAGLSVHSVTVHPFFQRATHWYGFRDSALLLAYVPQKAHFKEIAGQQLPQREPVVYGYRPLGADHRRRVFPPARHRSIIAQIYSNLGLDRELAIPDVSPPSYEGGSLTPGPCPFALSTHIKSNMRTALIKISDYGLGIEREVKTKLRDLCNERIAVVYLNIPLGAPQTAVACQHFEELGFFFAGILPGPAEEMESGDWLCLQYLNGSRIDYDLLSIYSDFGRELAGYVREQDPLA